jgi:hypothetical protein
LVTRVTHVETVPFRRVTAAYAALEGEGDGCEATGRTPDESMPIVCSVFEVVEVLQLAACGYFPAASPLIVLSRRSARRHALPRAAIG